MKNRKSKTIIAVLSVLLFLATTIQAQTTAFTYQGRLSDTGTPQSIYQMRFELYDALTDGNQVGATITNPSVTVTQGVFTVQLDFGAAAFDGTDRFLEVAVRRNAGDPFITLIPRQQIASSPYATRALNAGQADVALDSNKLGGVDASEYVTTTSVGSSFIKNSTTQQTGNFNISGKGTLGGTLQANEVKAQTLTGTYGLTHTDGTISLSSYIGGSSSGATGAWFGTQTNHPLHFFTNAGQPTMTINTVGNVGIGTANPTSKLHVAGAFFASGFSEFGGGLEITGNLLVSEQITAQNGLNVSGGVQVNGNATVNSLSVVNGNLSVLGAGAITLAFVPNGGDFGLCYKISTKSIANCSASSLRYKRDVQTFDGGLSIINRLRPISFSWKDDGRRDIGFAAEEVEQIEPLLTFRNERGEIEGVKYQLMGVVLVRAVKEQQTQIARQQQQIEQQQIQIENLKKLMCLDHSNADFCSGK